MNTEMHLIVYSYFVLSELFDQLLTDEDQLIC